MSTLCAALVCRGGWRLLSDELALVRLDDGLIEPLPRPISLKNASIDVIRAYAPEAVFSRSVHDTSKGTVAHVKPPSDSVARAGETARAGLIVFPAYAAGAAPLLQPIPQGRAMMQVAENAFNYTLLGEAGFHALGRLIDASASYRFSYSALDDAIEVFARLAAPEHGGNESVHPARSAHGVGVSSHPAAPEQGAGISAHPADNTAAAPAR